MWETAVKELELKYSNIDLSSRKMFDPSKATKATYVMQEWSPALTNKLKSGENVHLKYIVANMNKKGKDGRIETDTLHFRLELAYMKSPASKENEKLVRVRLRCLQGRRVEINWDFHFSTYMDSPFTPGQKGFDNSILSGPGDVAMHKATVDLHDFSLYCCKDETSRFCVQIYFMSDVSQNLDTGMQQLCSSFARLLDTGEMSDVKLVCGYKTFNCHKLVLAVRSNVFKKMLHAADSLKLFYGYQKGDHNEKEDSSEGNIIEIKDFQPEEVQQFINFCYTGKCDTSKVDSWKLLEMANKYEVELLADQCTKVNLPFDNASALFYCTSTPVLFTFRL